MNFYEYTQILGYIFICFEGAGCLNNVHLKVVETGQEDADLSAVGLKLYATVNNTSGLDYDVVLEPDQCCIGDSGRDCDVLSAVGSCAEILPKETVKTFKLVVPILSPYQRNGYCLAYLDSKADHRKRNAVTMRDTIKIPFDTRLETLKNLPANVIRCEGFDEDPFNKCEKVDCETFYNGKKSFYNRINKRCVEVPSCVSEDRDIPDIILNPVCNKCIVDESITKDDLEYIKALKMCDGRMPKDIVIIKNLKDKPSDGSVFKNNQNKKLMNSKFPTAEEISYVNAILVGKNKSGVAFLFFIIVLQFGLIITMVYFLAKRCWCRKRAKVENTFFNYRQDASITTPLIGVTTGDTETTCHFTSESSHIDRKIQCYKACQKETAKISLSDDILTKCLNRRNWDRKLVKSNDVELRSELSKNFDTLYLSSVKKDDKNIEDWKTDNDVHANKAEHSKEDKKTVTKSIVKKSGRKKTSRNIGDEEKGISDARVSETEVHNVIYECKDSKPIILEKECNLKSMTNTDISEREIRCHSFNFGVAYDNDSLKDSSHSYSDIKSATKQVYKSAFGISSGIGSSGRQVSAQASFSNDSIDDYISERGMLLLGDNLSKYSLSDGSVKSSMTSKTSKNNMLKHVLSFLRRDKQGPSSEPGGKKRSNADVNIELIHMSKATMYSSSNNYTECLKNISKAKDSRTSL